MKKFVNFHTHNLAPREDLIQVYIPSLEENHVDEKANYFCFGVHPWDIFKIKDEQIKTLIKYHCQNPRFLALGEIGLDKFKPSDFKRQQTIFKNQIEIARELNIKKIVLHCVRAYQECYEILKETNFKISIEAGRSDNWAKFIGQNGLSFGVDYFGKSAPYKDIFRDFKLTVNHIFNKTKKMIKKN